MPLSCRPAIPEGPRRKEPNMKTIRHLWTKRLATAAAAMVLPLAAMAHGMAGDVPENCPPMPHVGATVALPPHGLFPEPPPPGVMPMPPWLRGIELTEAQQDKLFALMHEQAPMEREQIKIAFKAMEELRRLASDRFDAGKARVLADTHALAIAQLTLMHAEMDAKVRALLTPQQRKQLDDARAKAESRRTIKRS
jgi:Spy/CpxP family protein refolding chaperone